MNYVEAMLEILGEPEADDARLRFAAGIEPADAARAAFIRLQIQRTLRRRTPDRDIIRPQEMQLLDRHESAWTEDISMFMGELPRDQHVEFDRGFVRCMSMNPYVFLEHGQYVMTRLAPIRGIWFFPDPEGAPFPMRELAASPLLARLDEIRLAGCDLTDDDVEVFAASPHLTRLCRLDLGNNDVGHRGIEALAANVLTRRCLAVQLEWLLPDEGVPNEHLEPDGYGDYDYWDMSDFGYALEAKYGHVPWLHPIENACYVADAHYWIEQKRLPVHQPGSPAAQPTRIGTPLRPAPRNPKRKRFEGWRLPGA